MDAKSNIDYMPCPTCGKYTLRWNISVPPYSGNVHTELVCDLGCGVAQELRIVDLLALLDTNTAEAIEIAEIRDGMRS